MRFVVYGAGAVGGVIGGRLAEHGHDVALIAAARTTRRSASTGLTVDRPTTTVTRARPGRRSSLELTFTDDDVVILAMKSQDTPDALTALAAAAAPTDSGRLRAERRRERAGRAAVLRERLRHVRDVPGRAPRARRRAGVLGADAGHPPPRAVPAGVDERRRARSPARCRASTFASEPRPDIMRWKYTKLLMNLGNAAEASFAPSDARDRPRRRERARKAPRCCARPASSSRRTRRTRRCAATRCGSDRSDRRSGAVAGRRGRASNAGPGAVESDYLNGEIVALGPSPRWSGAGQRGPRAAVHRAGARPRRRPVHVRRTSSSPTLRNP